uniref:Microtubule-associated protein mu-2 n=1 Tax=Reovirus type 2 (strain D5/Jones) TaxID=10885 RepID=MU2_REOVJ|nr:RecName: Full=Microtubule-associated protein mu-2; Short=Mu2 [Mammalian orthoreovirus 2 D5/Jones]AAK54467.1 minor reovirus core protein mu2 [Mammalian orthoreovirus 2]
MAYVAVPAVVDSRSSEAIGLLESFGVTATKEESDVQYQDHDYVLDQLQYMLDGYEAGDVIDALVYRNWLHESVYCLLPPKSQLLEYWKSNPAVIPESVDRRLRKRLMMKKDLRKDDEYNQLVRAFKLSDVYTPLVSSSTSPMTMIQSINQNQIVYSTTDRVIGARISLYAPRKYYSATLSFTLNRCIIPYGKNVAPIGHARFNIGTFPSLASPKCFVLSSVDIESIPNEFIKLFYQRVRSVHANILNDISPQLLSDMLQRKRLRVSSPNERKIAQIMHLPYHVKRGATHVDVYRVDVVDVLFEVVDIKDGLRSVSRKLTLQTVPVSVIELIGLETADYCIRKENGMFTDWFLLLTMLSDGLIDRRTHSQYLINPSSIPPDVIINIYVSGFTNRRVIDVMPEMYDFVKPIGAVLPKGSFKSTIMRVLDEMEVLGVRIMPRCHVVDSDEVGERMQPTFEHAVMEIYKGIAGVDSLEELINWVLGPDLIPHDERLGKLYQSFLPLAKDLLAPVARHFYEESLSEGRLLTFAHADSELLNANYFGHLLRLKIPFITEVNLMIRKNREGGELFQLVLSYLYKMYATSAQPMWFGSLLRLMICPWLHMEKLIGDADAAITSAEVGWHIPKEHLMQDGWCGCEDGFITYVVIRAPKLVLEELREKNWGQYHAQVIVTDRLEVGEPRRVHARVVIKGNHMPSKLISRYACFSLTMRYMMHLTCGHSIGRSSAYGARLVFRSSLA